MSSPSPNVTDMNTSVLLTATQLPSYGVFNDTVSFDYGTGADLCGSRLFKITSIASSTSTISLSSSELHITNTGQITLLASDSTKVGTHTATVTVYLASYTNITLDLPPFTITVTQCVVTKVKIVQAVNKAIITT